MKIKNMEKYFEYRILRRGYEYYEKEYVKDVKRVNNIIQAKVLGTRKYNVTINLIGDDDVIMQCNCPYATEWNDNCKHMAAVLYYLKENIIPESEEYTDRNITDNFADRFRLKIFNLGIANMPVDEDTYPIYLSALNESIVEIKKILKLDSFKGFECIKFLYDYVNELENSESYYDEDDDYYYDDNEYNIAFKLGIALDRFIDELLESKKIKIDMIKYLETSMLKEYEEDLIKKLVDSVDCIEVAKHMLKLIDARMNKINYKNYDYDYYTLLGYKLNIMYNYIDPIEAVECFFTFYYMNSSEKRKIEQVISTIKDCGNINMIISIVSKIEEESEIIDIIGREQLLDIYYVIDKEKYKKLAIDLFYKYCNAEYYFKIRKVLSFDECTKYLKLLEEKNNFNDCIAVYVREHLEDKIYNIIKDKEYYIFKQYCIYLGDDYKDKIVEKYIDETKKKMKARNTSEGQLYELLVELKSLTDSETIDKLFKEIDKANKTGKKYEFLKRTFLEGK